MCLRICTCVWVERESGLWWDGFFIAPIASRREERFDRESECLAVRILLMSILYSNEIEKIITQALHL